MKKRFRQLGWGLLSLSILLVCVLLYERFRGSHAFNARFQALKARGERLTVRELEPRRAAPENNAALAICALSNRLTQLNSNLVELPPAGRFSAPGRIVASWQFEAWKGLEVKTNTWKDLSERLDAGEDFIKAIHAGLQKSEWDANYNYHNGFFDFTLPPLAQVKRESQILDASVACALRQGRNDEALERLNDSIRIVALQKNERLIISQLVRIACASMAWNSTWELLQTNVWNESQLSKIQDGWQQMDFSEDMAIALEMERAMTLDHFQIVQSSGAKLTHYIELAEKSEELLGNEFSLLPTHGVVLHYVHLPVYRFAWVKQDALCSLTAWQDIIETERMARTQSLASAAMRVEQLNSAAGKDPWFQTKGEKPKETLYDRWRFLISRGAAVNGTTIAKVTKAETARRMLIAALALKRYSLQHGRPPKDFEELVPAYLPAVPIDGMDGKPLRYRLLESGNFILYSVGEDGVDNGGDCSPIQGKARVSQIWDGKDAVWPSLAKPEEVPAAIWR